MISKAAYNVWHVPPSLVLNIFMVSFFSKAETMVGILKCYMLQTNTVTPNKSEPGPCKDKLIVTKEKTCKSFNTIVTFML